MNIIRGLQYARLVVLTLLCGLLAQPALAAVGVREAAVGLERQLKSGKAATAKEYFRLPLTDSMVVLKGEATLEPIAGKQCRRTVELVHNEPFERRGVRITNISRRSVEEGSCEKLADALSLQAENSAKSIAEQIGIGAVEADTMPGTRVLVSQPALPPQQDPSAAVSLTVLEKALIRDAPAKSGEKLSRADAGTRLKAWRIPGNPDWFALDGGLRFISASVVDVTETASAAAAPARGDTSRVRLKVMERAVLRNAPSFKGQKVASLAAGVERLARKVPGMVGWFELMDSDNRYPLYIHESVVDEKPSDKRM